MTDWLTDEFSRISGIIDLTSRYAYAGDWQGFDDILVNVVLTHLYDTEIIAYARSTYPMREKLPSWGALVLRAKAEFEKRCPNEADQLLQGLL